MNKKKGYSIQEVIEYRKLNWFHSNDFIYLKEVPINFESFWIQPEYCCFAIIHSGKVVIENETGGLETAEKGSFILFKPSSTYKILEILPGTTGAGILFNRNFLVSFSEDVFYLLHNSFINTLSAHVIGLQAADYSKLTVLFAQVFELLTTLTPHQWNYSAKGLFLTLVNETDGILQHYKSNRLFANAEEQQLISSFLHLSSVHFIQHREVAFYAGKLHVSVGHLHRTIKKVLNTTPINILHKSVLQEAKQLLAFSNKNISEIADMLQFGSVHSFSKFFKKHTGVSPSHYVNAD
ncbi:helix-turn-helix transcriptional regulator [Chryseobacterium taichungense]|uniref:helix-turn-helix transcriptional regulator n=1 Tax=Chryseobacterium taichungense TaxID=295069 RepID=UPI0028B0C288|nr:helix-turn-helix transcriptional regulator [Chryseobacterium taichungense]